MNARKLLLIGWDAADWALIHPLLDQGQMPNLQRVIESGVMGRISTLDPPLSPLLWTSIATGKTADEHGILGFTEPDPASGGARLASSTSRNCKAIWNILHQNGLRTNVVNWFASHPAEPLRGTCISNAACMVSAEVPADAIHPAELASTLLPLRLSPADLRGEDLALFLPGLERIDQNTENRVVRLARYLSEGLTAHAMATWILEQGEWDFLAVYLDTIDHAGHDFMIYHPPRMEQISETDFELFQHVMTGVYKMHDLMLGRLLQLAGPDATVMIVSDHGFASGAARTPQMALHPHADLMGWHRQHGIVCLAGPGIRKDELVLGASLLDVTPTILALFGLPAGQDMKGRVLAEAFEAPPSLERIPSWEAVQGEAGLHPPERIQENWDAAAAMEQLVALGYIDEPSADLALRRKAAVDFQKFALARVHLGNRRPAEAIPLLEDLARENPANAHLRAALGQAYFRAGQYERSGQIASEQAAFSEAGVLSHILRANSCIFQGNADEALVHLQTAGEIEGSDPKTLVLIAQAYARLDRPADAEVYFRKALAVDSQMAHAWCGLARVMLAGKRFEEAAAAAMEAVALQYELAAAHCLLGMALAQSGALDRAMLALETTIKLRPSTLLAHRWLEEIHTRVTGDAGRAAHHRDFAAQIAADRGLAAQPGVAWATSGG